MALSHAIQTLVNFAARKVAECPPEEQIEIYQALAEALPDPEAQRNARELAHAVSRVSALQLEFRTLLPPAQHDGE